MDSSVYFDICFGVFSLLFEAHIYLVFIVRNCCKTWFFQSKIIIKKYTDIRYILFGVSLFKVQLVFVVL